MVIYILLKNLERSPFSSEKCVYLFFKLVTWNSYFVMDIIYEAYVIVPKITTWTKEITRWVRKLALTI